ncbi:MAG: hypothetical protein R3Y27_08330 [Clostridia bacterium]
MTEVLILLVLSVIFLLGSILTLSTLGKNYNKEQLAKRGMIGSLISSFFGGFVLCLIITIIFIVLIIKDGKSITQENNPNITNNLSNQ